jgi:tripeptide aminopeptidase
MCIRDSGKEEQVIEFVENFCKEHDLSYTKDKMNNIFITKGISDIYPCFIAHTDTVSSIVENKTVIELNGCLFAMNAFTMDRIDIGGDDLNGCYICLQSLLELDICKVALFSSEEIGAIGSYESDISFFDDVSFGLQFDRKGNEGFVINACGVELSTKEFQDTILPTISKYQYKFVNGGMTDVMALKEIGVTCPLANIECGYYNPHSSDSFVVIEDVERVLLTALELVENYGKITFAPQELDMSYEYEWYNVKEEPLYCNDCYKPVDSFTNKEDLCDECYDYYYQIFN